jgi:YegS/Rv2252/BmrU family lipid kinase
MYQSRAMRISVVVNPRAGAGSAARQLPKLRRSLEALGAPFEILETRQPGHATALAVGAIEGGATLIAVVGGDGTLNEVSQAYVDARGAPVHGPPIALIPCGTGGDFPRSCRFTRSDVGGGVERLAARRERPLDLGVITLHDIQGRRIHRAFLNVASVGISGAVDERVARGPKWLGGKAAFLLGTLGAALGYQNVPVEIEIDGAAWHTGPTLITAIANGQFLGGGMQIAPHADFADGLLDVVCVGDLSRSKFLSLFPNVYKGAHLGLESVRSQRARRVAIRAVGESRPVLVDVDGETPGYLPLEARIFPGALQLIGD